MSVHFVLSETGRLYCDQGPVTFSHASYGAQEDYSFSLLCDGDGKLHYCVADALKEFLTEKPMDTVSKSKVKSNFDAIYGAAKTSDSDEAIEAAYSWRPGKDGTLSFGKVVGEGVDGDDAILSGLKETGEEVELGPDLEAKVDSVDASKAKDINDMTKEELIEWMSLSSDDPVPWSWTEDLWTHYVKTFNTGIKDLVEEYFLKKETNDHFKRLQESLAWLTENYGKDGRERYCGEPAADGKGDSSAQVHEEPAKPVEDGGVDGSAGVYGIHGAVNTCEEVIGPFFLGESGVEVIAPLSRNETGSLGISDDQIVANGISNSLIGAEELKRFPSEHELSLLADFIRNNPGATAEAYTAYAEKIKAAFDALEG